MTANAPAAPFGLSLSAGLLSAAVTIRMRRGEDQTTGARDASPLVGLMERARGMSTGGERTK